MTKKAILGDAMTNEQRYEVFESHLKLEHGLSDSTIKNYIGSLKAFRIWLDSSSQGLPIPWAEVGENELRRFITVKQPSPAYAGLLISTFSRFFSFMRDITRERQDDPAKKITRPKQAKHLQAVLEPWQVDKLMVHAWETSQESVKLRNWSMIAFLYGTGLRISEACTLLTSNIRYQDEIPVSVTVIGKGNKERTVFLNPTAKDGLYKWMKERQTLLLDLPPNINKKIVWLVPTGKYKGSQWQPQSVRKMLKKFSAEVFEGEKHVHPHMFRHTFVTEAVKARAPLHAIQAAAGHADLSTTGRYMHANTEDIKQVADLVPDAQQSEKPS